MSKYVSFEISKLLKEKDFNEPCDDYYTSKGMLNSNGYGDIIFDQGFNSGGAERMLKFDYSDFDKKQKEDYFLCPTILNVVDWLNEKFGIWIYNTCDVDGNFYPHIYFSTESNWQNLELRSKMNEGNRVIARNDYKSPQEAYLGTIKHVLKHMI